MLDKKIIKSAFPYILIFLTISLISGVFRVEYMLNLVESTFAQTAKISAYISLLLSVFMVFIYLLAVFGVIIFSLALMGELADKQTIKTTFKLVKGVLIVYSISEICKLFIFLKLVRNNLFADFSLSSEQDVFNIFTTQTLFRMNNIVDLSAVIIIIGMSYYFLHLKLHIKILKVAVPMSVFLLLYVFYHYDFLMNFLT